MNDFDSFSQQQAKRLLGGIVAVLLGAIVSACLTAPPLYHLFSWLARYLTASRHLQELEFGRVVTRAFLVYLIVFSVIAVRRVRDLTWGALGLPRVPHWRRALIRGCVWGVVTLGALLLWALVGGGMEWAPPVWTRWVPRLITYAVGAVLIGFIEEIFFRGALFGMSRRLMPWFWAALWTSLFFSFVHFISPRFPEEAVVVDAWAGFRILPHLVDTAREPEFYWPLSLNLFLIGMVLCTWYQREGHCWTVIGVHAGWVWCLRMGRLLMDRNPEAMTWWWGSSSHIGRSGLATIMLLAVWVWIYTRPTTIGSGEERAHGREMDG